jgi:large subunit ribosomal protein L29
MKAEALRSKSLDELDGILKSLGEEKFKLKMASKVEKPHLVKQVRKNIALVLTIANEKRRKEHE